MLSNNNSYNYDNRNLSDVFKELQNKNYSNDIQLHTDSLYYGTIRRTKHSGFKHIIIAIIFLFSLTAIVGTSIFAKSNMPEYEPNENILNIQNIISSNADITKFKEQVVTDCNVVFATILNDNPSLPRGEENVIKKGSLGKDKVTYVRTYENQKQTDEIELSRVTVTNPVSQIIEVGTSDFLAKHNVHIGDTMYLNDDYKLKKSNDKSSKDVIEIKLSMDVKLIELASEEWCKVSYEDKEGYVETSFLVSETTAPDIVEKNRLTRILKNVNKDMELNKSSGLTEKDFKKILTNLPEDKKDIFKNNYKVFYDMDTKYNINGIFLASIAIHESAWGMSTIANDKKNLFGYGAYDNSPYESAYNFDEYSDGIETVAKALVKYYLNPAGTKIYDGEKANGSFYNGPTVADVNIKYATDPNWHEGVFSYMKKLYDILKDGENK